MLVIIIFSLKKFLGNKTRIVTLKRYHAFCPATLRHIITLILNSNGVKNYHKGC